MKKVSMNQDWLFANGTITMMELFTGSGEQVQKVDLPHDAMILQERRPDTANAHQTGFYPGGEYTYIKKWYVPKEWEERITELEFEGIADICRIYVNGDFVAGNYNPYAGIYIDVTGYLKYGQENEVKVEVLSIEQSSRWYSGAGLYRPVHIWTGGRVHIPSRGVRIVTEDADKETALLSADIPICSRGTGTKSVQLRVALEDAEGREVSCDTVPVTVFEGESQCCSQRLTVTKPHLWSDETPYLYTFHAELLEDAELLDEYSSAVGIRTLRLNAAQGLLVNGVPTKLRGTCIHHDNGIIGAATFPDAEFRRCRILKEAGFNAVRSSHHPVSKAMLDACDRLGIYVMDELNDMWTRTKNPHDYANYFPEHWKKDVREMIEKDRNHPSVIIYSTGNEIPEAGTPRGAQWNRKIHEEIKRLDPARYTTNGINGLMAGTERMDEIMCQATGLSPEELEKMMTPDTDVQQAGADAVNGMAAVMIGPLADSIATCPVMEELLGEFASVTDIAGYNYLTALHEEDHRRHPNRVVLGTETFPADIVSLWDIVCRNPHVLGDFTWTGYDYLGEAGCGVFHYDGGENFSSHWPDRLAGIGDIDILGDRKPISYLRQAVFGIGTAPAIGVMRMDKEGKHADKTPWMWKDNIASWTWHGYEGKEARVDVYADSDEVEVFLNGETLGRRQVRGHIAEYDVPYYPGRLEAVSYRDGAETGRCMLQTAGQAVRLDVTADREALPADGESLAFLKVRLKDHEGRWNRQETKEVSVQVEGTGILQGFGNADPSCEGSYQDTMWSTYDGAVMAAIRAAKEPGEVRVTFRAEGCPEETVTLSVY